MLLRIFALLTLLCAVGASTAATSSNPAIERAISALVYQFSDGIAEPYSEEPPVIRYGPIFGEKSDDAVVFFSLDGFGGSNHHVEYIAFFAVVPPTEIAGSASRPYRLMAVSEIGARGWRTFDWKTAVPHRSAATVSGLQMRSGDALCCPSLPVTITFHIDDFHGRIVETKEPSRPPGETP